MEKRADVVIAGGGCMGTSTAFNLARKGCTNVILIEKEKMLGMGSTGLCAGGIRQQFSTKINTILSMASVKIFENFEKEVGLPINFQQNGYLFLASTEEEMENFKLNVELQRSLGLNVEIITPESALKKVPRLNVEDIVGGAFCQTDGVVDPHEVNQAFATAARALGVKIYEDTSATGIEIKNGKVSRIITNKGDIETPVVVNAAGPFAGEFARMAGINLPVLPYRRQIFVTEPFPEIPDDIPLVVDFHSDFYFRKETGGLLMGMGDPDEPSSFNTHTDRDFMERLVERAVHRVPAMERANIIRGWGGLYEITPDFHAVLGKVPEVEGFFCINGFSGHGFMHSPIVGKLIAELIIEGKTSIDISSLSITRFKEGKLIRERAVVG